MRAVDCCILNSGGGSWAFEALAHQLSSGALWVDIAPDKPREFNYLLLSDDAELPTTEKSFTPLNSLRIAADKRLLAAEFHAKGVPIPETHLLESLQEAKLLLSKHGERRWCLKFPTGCGASGHRMLTTDMELPVSWPRPLVVQEFITMARPEVYRLYGAGSRLFGWNARRFPIGSKVSPWVAHVRWQRPLRTLR